MKFINNNEGLLNFLTGNNSLIDSVISRFDIYHSEYQLNIDVYINLLYAKKELKLQFKNVLEYCFYHNSTHYFYNVERYKLLKSDKGFYVSFDPVDERFEINADDNDFILSKNVDGYFVG